MVPKGLLHQEGSLRGTARVCFLSAFVCLATFVYSLSTPVVALDQLTRFAQNEHYRFLLGGRWWFLIAFALLGLAGLTSVARANRINTGRLQ